MTQQKSEISYINNLKALGIVLVVLGHAESPLKSFLYLFQISLFFFVAGYLYNDTYNEKPLALISKRIKSLYLPFLQWNLFFIIIHNLIYNIGIYKDEVIYNKIYFINEFKWLLKFNSTELMLAGFWFLKTLFLTTILFCTVNYVLIKVFKDKNKIVQPIVVCAIYIVGNILMYLINELKYENIFKVSHAIIVFYFGYLYKRYEDKIKVNLAFSIIATLVLFYMGNKYGSIDMANNIYVNPIYYIIASLLGIYLCVYISKTINNRIINYIGKNTIIILALHFLCFKIIDYFYLTNNKISMLEMSNFPIITKELWLWYSIIGILLPIGIKYIHDNLKKTIIKTK